MHWVQFTIYAAQCILCTIYGTIGSCWIEPSVTEACDKLQNFMNLHCKGKLNSWLPKQKKFKIFCKKKYCLITCKGEPQCPGLLLRSPLCLRRRSGEGNQRDGGLQTFSAVPAWVDVEDGVRHINLVTGEKNETWRCSPVTPRPPLPVLPDSSPGSNLLSTLKTIHWWQELFLVQPLSPGSWELCAAQIDDAGSWSNLATFSPPARFLFWWI